MKKIHIALAIIALLCLFSFVNLSDSRPFMDEGTYIAGGWLFSQGQVPYIDFSDNKMPGIFFATGSVFSISAGLFSARLLMGIIAVITLIAIFLAGKKMFNEKTGFAAAALFAIWAAFLGSFWAVIEPFLALFSLLGVFFFWKYLKEQNKRDILLAGLFIGVAFIFKQTMLLFAVAFIVLALLGMKFYSKQKIVKKDFILAIAGFFIPVLALLAYLLATGSFPAFLETVFGYYSSRLDFFSSIAIDYRYVPAALFLSLIPIAFVVFRNSSKDEKNTLVILAAFFIACLSNLLPLRGCCLHFIPLLPAVALISGFAVSKAFENKKKPLLAYASLMIILSLAFAVFYQAEYSQPKNGFESLREVSAYIDSQTGSAEKIFVLPASPEVYFLSKREPGTKQLQFFDPCTGACAQNALADLEKNKPKIIVYFSSTGAVDETAWEYSFLAEKYVLQKKMDLKYPLYNYYNYALFFELKE